ncbi:3',5'-cyclic AMP phosphodiesterase CpdA [Neobacillus niacini]|uniref:metallophosphoesterase family protein n=1 Tax=Neobacillus driksii TaxID=3035913 RepID=UPI00278251C6|nr:metallophosphoesterase family protein [Neobacillus niacini]MDQ0974752.1 3',5'-cyclic AMP phosphodiesterase CpdA [Neobacillus niacini]
MELCIGKDGAFTILQLTDLHVGSMPFNEHDLFTFNHIKDMADKANPDLIVISGDLIWSEGVPDQKASFKELIKVLNDLKKPIAITYGNHDTEEGISRSDLRSLEDQIDLLVEKKNLHVIEDRESYCVEIKNHAGEISNVLYFIDSGANDPLKIGQYEFVHPDQVTWFNEVSKKYTNRTKNFKQDLLILHIPLPEYKEAFTRGQVSGTKYEEISSPEVNTGLFTSLLLNGNVAGVFCGHDHDNDFVADYQGIKLCFGRISGFNCYGELHRGARVITLYDEKPLDTRIIETEKYLHYK